METTKAISTKYKTQERATQTLYTQPSSVQGLKAIGAKEVVKVSQCLSTMVLKCERQTPLGQPLSSWVISCCRTGEPKLINIGIYLLGKGVCQIII